MADSPITSREKDFAAWYQDVVLAGDMAEPAEIVKGCMVIKPNGYAVWEILQRELDNRFNLKTAVRRGPICQTRELDSWQIPRLLLEKKTSPPGIRMWSWRAIWPSRPKSSRVAWSSSPTGTPFGLMT